jgi:hypothetical protein
MKTEGEGGKQDRLARFELRFPARPKDPNNKELPNRFAAYIEVRR